jgi:hypothetical protein
MFAPNPTKGGLALVLKITWFIFENVPPFRGAKNTENQTAFKVTDSRIRFSLNADSGIVQRKEIQVVG